MRASSHSGSSSEPHNLGSMPHSTLWCNLVTFGNRTSPASVRARARGACGVTWGNERGLIKTQASASNQRFIKIHQRPP